MWENFREEQAKEAEINGKRQKEPNLKLWKNDLTDLNMLGKKLSRKPLGVQFKLESIGVVDKEKSADQQQPP